MTKGREERQSTVAGTDDSRLGGLWKTTPLPHLSKEEIDRYSRHLIMPEVGMDGQRQLKAASVLLIDAGGLGSPLGLYLAAAGIGRFGLVDFDVVDYSNLQRQIMHGTKDVGRPKLQSARDRLLDGNPHTPVAYGVQSIPTLLLFKGGQLVEHIKGAVPKPRIVDALHRVVPSCE